MTGKEKIWAFITIAFPASTVILLHAYLGSFLRLIGDDYCTVYYADRLGIFRSAWYWYLSWAGVYARSFTNVVLVWASENTIFWFIVPGVLLTWFLASASVIGVLLRNELKNKDRFWFSIFLTVELIFATLLVSPKNTQSVHWWAGMNAYLSPIVSSTIYILFLLLIIKKPLSKYAITFLSFGSFAFALFVGGFSETFTPILLVFFVVLIGVRLIIRQTTVSNQEYYFLIAGMIGTVTAFVIMIAAPGNAIRQALYPVHFSAVSILQISFKGYFAFLHNILNAPEKLSGLVGVFVGSVWLGSYSISKGKPHVRFPLAILALGNIFAFLCFPPAAYGMSDVPPDRALLIPVYILVVSIISAGYVSGRFMFYTSKEHARTVRISLSFLVTVLMVFSAWHNSMSLYNSRHVYIEFAQLWDSVNKQILDAKANGETSAEIPWMYNWTNLEMPNNNPKYWVTVCISKYYEFPVFGPDPDISPPW